MKSDEGGWEGIVWTWLEMERLGVLKGWWRELRLFSVDYHPAGVFYGRVYEKMWEKLEMLASGLKTLIL